MVKVITNKKRFLQSLSNPAISGKDRKDGLIMTVRNATPQIMKHERLSGMKPEYPETHATGINWGLIMAMLVVIALIGGGFWWFKSNTPLYSCDMCSAD